MEANAAATRAAAAKEYRLRLELEETTEPPEGGSVPFFGGRRERGGAEHTWVVSSFVAAHLAVFVISMIVNDCPSRSSAGDCAAKSLGRFAFQPLRENPLFGPSDDTLVKMGALQRTLMIQQNQKWRLMTCPWLHVGVIHLSLDLLSTIFIGIHLEQDFGSTRTAMIYLFSALLGSVASAAFVHNIPAVCSSGALFGLLGGALSGLIRNWQIYTFKYRALVALAFVSITNFGLGLLPHVDNFSSIGGLLSGFLLGFILLFNPQLLHTERKKGLFVIKNSVKLRQKLDKPTQRIIALIFFSIILGGGLYVVLCGVDASKHCSWCSYINCVPTKMWRCNDKTTHM